MRLKSLQLLGFKSFADKIKLNFNSGITAVVGPNGCGKSNIADGFRWVFGEQSAKSMRGGKSMTDVIFAGANTRASLNIAEVTVTLADICGALPTEYEELSVTRRLHRSGESEYLLNGKSVRLKDILALFLDSGIGKSCFSIFEQGKIEQMIHSTPLERRAIFEEAAGILRFLQRKKEALRQLEQAELNITRVKDIHCEVEKQIVVLEEQSIKAKAFKELKGSLEVLEKGVLFAKTKRIEKKLLETTAREKETTYSFDGASNNVVALQRLSSDSSQALDQMEKSFRQKSQELYSLRSDKEIRVREKRNRDERLKESRTKEMRWCRELEELIEQKLYRQRELDDLKKKQNLEKGDFSLLENSCKSQKENVIAVEAEVVELRKKQQVAQEDSMRLFQRESRIAGDLGQNAVRLESSMDRERQVLEHKEKLVAIQAELALLMKEKEALVAELKEGIDAKREVFYQIEEKIAHLNGDLKSAQQEIDCSKAELGEKEARLLALQRLKDDMEGFSASSKRLLSESADRNSILYGKVRSLCEILMVASGLEAAAAASLSTYSQTLVVDTIEDWKLVIDFAKDSSLGDFSLIALDLIRKKNVDISALPKELIDSMKPICDGIESPLSHHFLNSLFVADSNDEALAFLRHGASVEVWFKDNSLIDRNSVYFQIAQGGSNLFLREAEIQSLELTVEELKFAKSRKEDAYKKLEQNRSEQHAEMMELDKAIRRKEMSLVEANFGFQKLQSDKDKNSKELVHVDNELEALRKNVVEQKSVIDELQKCHTEAKLKLSEAHSLVVSIDEDLQTQTMRLKREQQCLEEQEAIYSKALQDIHQSEHAIHLIEAKDAASQRQEMRLEEEIALTREFQTTMVSKDGESEKLLQEIEASLEVAQKECDDLDKAIAEQKNAIQEIALKIEAAGNELKLKEKERYQLGILLAQMETAYTSMKSEILEKFKISYEQAENQFLPLEASLDQSEKQMRVLKHAIETTEDINMTSIEECAKHKVRFEFLSKQIADLGDSKQQIVQIITELDSESRKRFKETFLSIATNFKKNFSILFNGGDADLLFTESENVLEAGIEIKACPPGKQMRSMTLLSGGEKCMTAMALLFAIFEVKITPFCILDEIDAPLDDSNVERFASLVRQFTDKCQFIIITHNKQTMAIADSLYGISMEEKGVSKLLQMEFSSAENPQEVSIEV